MNALQGVGQNSGQLVSRDQQVIDQIFGTNDAMVLMCLNSIQVGETALKQVSDQFKHFKEETSKIVLAKSEESNGLRQELALSRAQTNELRIAHQNDKEASQKLVKSIQENLDKKGKELSTTQGSLSKNQVDLHAAQGEVASLSAQINQLRTAHEAEVASLKNRIKTLETDSNEKTQKLAQTQTQLNNRTTSLNTSQQQLASTTAALNAAKVQVAAISGSLAGVQATLAGTQAILAQTQATLTVVTNAQNRYYGALLAIRQAYNAIPPRRARRIMSKAPHNTCQYWFSALGI